MKNTNDILERTVINATSRVLRKDSGRYTYEVVIGFLPIDDIVSFESKEFKSLENCVASMFSAFSEHVKALHNGYEP